MLINAEVVFRSNSSKMMNIHGPLDFLLKVSDQSHSISNCHDVGAKILNRYLRLHIDVRHINFKFSQEKEFAEKGLLAFEVLNEFK